MNKEEVKLNLDNLYQQRDEINKKIATVRTLCKHEDYHVGYYSYRIGEFSVVRLCDYCGEVLGEPNELEIEQFDDTLRILKK